MNEFNRIPLDQETIFTDFDCAEENARQAKLVSFPEGFHEVIAPDGKLLGYGFYCSRCKLHFPGNAPKRSAIAVVNPSSRNCPTDSSSG